MSLLSLIAGQPQKAILTTLFCMAIAVALPLPVSAQVQKQAVPAVAATTTTASVAAPSVSGTTMDKKPFQLESLKGKVVVLMFWSTDCAVCRDQMPELRENVRGWADKPFELVLVSVDKRMEDVDSYNAILNKSVPTKQRFTQLWVGEPGFKDNLGAAQLPRNQLPVTYLIDKTGKLVERNNGRIPAAWWDVISDLL
jgi:cytochrome oxidase Cu insertion factor (SCO1/SenC/PrrC family)